jgi:hypothetical protein
MGVAFFFVTYPEMKIYSFFDYNMIDFFVNNIDQL